MVTVAIALVTILAPADLVIENARIWSDGVRGYSEFAAIRDGRFVYVGTRDRALIGPRTLLLDAKRQLVIPGLIDSHAHMIGGGLELSQLNLRDAKDKTDFVRMVREWSASLPKGKWIVGGRWSVESWSVRESPNKGWFDGFTGDRPLWLERMDGHSGVANSAALKLAGITKETPDPEGGVIDRDANGEPTGILRETAMDLVSAKIPPDSPREILSALKKAVDHALANGVTSVSDIASAMALPIYEQLAKDPSLKGRLFVYCSTDNWTGMIGAAKRFKGREGWIEVKGFKAYMDGSLGSRTAYMHSPFHGNAADKPDWRGLPMPGVLDGKLERNVKAVDAAGFQAIVHAIGDEGNHVLLDILERASKRTSRPRSEHTQHLLPGDIVRFGSLGVIASMQPYHKADDGRYAEDYIGPERSKSSYAYRSLLNSGARVAFGSDWPVVTINPFLGMEAAVTGRILNGTIWQPQENISVHEALRASTSTGAYAVFEENEIGKIAPGYRADFVVLNVRELTAVSKWNQVKPNLVFVEGRQVYQAPLKR